MPKGKIFLNESGINGFWFYCPGCKCTHGITYTGPNEQGAQWGFNGDVNFPTITPSILCNQHNPESRCHSFVTNGKINFLSDCFHELKGTEVDLPDWDEDRD